MSVTLSLPIVYLSPAKYVAVPSVQPVNEYPVFDSAVPDSTVKLCPIVRVPCVGSVPVPEPLFTYVTV